MQRDTRQAVELLILFHNFFFNAGVIFLWDSSKADYNWKTKQMKNWKKLIEGNFEEKHE